MSATALATLVTHWRGLCLRHARVSDAELLQRFARLHDAAAFEQLVERHASLVWGVCRRVLPREADCEDAFQATFLALVRRAASLDSQRPLGAWLHTVARRIARKAQLRSLRQRTCAVPPDCRAMPDVAGEVGGRELLRAVDEEIVRLPAALREPVVLCCLEGRTRDEAAEALGCSVAAIKSRLERGRGQLRRRLERRGIKLPAAFLVLSLTGGRVSAALRTKAVQSALGSAPPAVAALLASSAMPAAGKLALTALSLMVAGAIGFGAMRVAEADPPKDEPARKTLTQPAVPPLVDKTAEPRRDRFGDPLPEGAFQRFGTLRFRHHEIAEVTFTPDGKQLLAGSGRSHLSVFDSVAGRKLHEVGKVSPNNVYGFALSPDGKKVACCGFDLTLWDLETGKLIRELDCGRCSAVAFSPDGSKIVSVKEHRADFQVVEAATGLKLAEWSIGQGEPQRYWVHSIAYSLDGRLVAALITDVKQDTPGVITLTTTKVHILDAEKGTAIASIGKTDGSLAAFAFQPGSKRLATVGKGGAIQFWDVETGKEAHNIPVPGKTEMWSALRFSADGDRCAVYEPEGHLAVLDAKTGKELVGLETGKPTGSFRSPVAIALSPDGRTVVLGKQYSDATVRVWDVESGKERLADAGHRNAAKISLSDNGDTLISRGEPGRVFHWDLRTGEVQVRNTDDKDETKAVSGSTWDSEGARCPRWRLKIDHNKLEMEVGSLDGAKVLGKTKLPTLERGFAVSPDGTRLAISFQDAKHTILLWNPEKEEEPRKLEGHPDACQKLLFTHDGKRLIAGAGTHNNYPTETLWLWDVATGKVQRKLASNSAPGHMLLTADDRVLITGGLWNDATVRIWDMETGELLATLADPSLPATSEDQNKFEFLMAITGIVLSPDERFLAVITGRGNTSSVGMWETATWKPIRVFKPIQPRSSHESIVFSRDGRSLFVANSDTTILEWDVSGRRGKKAEAPAEARFDALWQALSEAPDKAYPALWEMLDHPVEAARYLKTKLSAVKPVEEKRLRQLIGRLDADTFEDRAEANRQLLALGEPALPVLREALKGDLSLEARKRIEKIVTTLTGALTADQQRHLRALAVLEWSGLREANEQLKQLAGGQPDARLTRAAKTSWQRIELKDSPNKP